MDALKDLASLLKDPQSSVSLAVVIETDLAADRSVLRALVKLWPDEQEAVCRVAWDSVGPNAGIFQFPQKNDLVLVEFPEKDEDSAVITKRFSSKEDKIPVTASDGSTVIRSLESKKLWLTSPTRVNISKGDNEPTENLVLGQTFKQTYLNHLLKLITLTEKLIAQRETDSTHTHIGIFGVPVNVPIQQGAMQAEKTELENIKAEVEVLKADDVESSKILSDYSFTEK